MSFLIRSTKGVMRRRARALGCRADARTWDASVVMRLCALVAIRAVAARGFSVTALSLDTPDAHAVAILRSATPREGGDHAALGTAASLPTTRADERCGYSTAE